MLIENYKKRITRLENSLQHEISSAQALKTKIKQIKKVNTDSEWRLQEKIAQLKSELIAKEETLPAEDKIPPKGKELKENETLSTEKTFDKLGKENKQKISQKMEPSQWI